METEHLDLHDRPNRIPWPPLIYAAALVIGAVLGWLVALPWIEDMAREIVFGLGIVMIAAALGIDAAAMMTMHRAKTTILPNRKADHLVTKGVFAFSRNPIYVANTMLVIGAAFISGIAWFLPLAFIAAFLTQKLAIEREEKHLEARFGKYYRDYKKKVNRWI